jgi:hypothetical protein
MHTWTMYELTNSVPLLYSSGFKLALLEHSAKQVQKFTATHTEDFFVMKYVYTHQTPNF